MRLSAIIVLSLSAWVFPALALDLKFNVAATENTVETLAREIIIDVLSETVAYKNLANVEAADEVEFWSRQLISSGQRSLQTLGYYQAKIEVERIASEPIRSLVIHVKTGQPVLIRALEITINGKLVNPPRYFSKLLVGHLLNHQYYEAAKTQLLRDYVQQGYLDALFDVHTILVNPDERWADVRLSLVTGPQFLFGDTRFNDLTLASSFLKRFIPYTTGDALQSAALENLSKNLRESNYFDSVEVSLLIEQADHEHRVPIQVHTIPVKRSLYEAGVSLGTDRGPGVDGAIVRRRANARGHHWEVRSEALVRRQYLAGRYTIPDTQVLTTLDTIDLNITNEETDAVDRVTTRTSYSHQDQWHGWRRTQSLSLQNEQYAIADDDQESTMMLGSMELFKRRTDQPVTPTRGWRVRTALTLAADALLSETNFVKIEINAKAIGSWGKRGRWIGRTRIGSSWADDFDKIPVSERFFSGGDHSVRGFDYQSLSPRNTDGDLLGGSHTAELSLELDWPINPNWRVAWFADAGGTYGDGDELTGYAVGVGLRWLSPVGPLRLDVATPLNGEDRGLRLHFSAGPDL